MSNALSNLPPSKQPATSISVKGVSVMWLGVKNILGSTRGKIGALLAGAPLWKLGYDLIDAWGNAQMVWPYFRSVIDFLGTNWGSLVLMVFGFLLIALQIRRQNYLMIPHQQSQEPAALAGIREACSEKWIHELADNDRRFIENYVKVESCDIVGHDLLNELYVDFKLSILNASVHTIRIDDTIEGDIYFNTRLLRNPIKKIENPARHIRHGDSQHLIIRQWLSSEEVGHILSASEDDGKFILSSLVISIRGVSSDNEVFPKKLKTYGLAVPNKPLLDVYRKIEIEIKQATFRGHWRFGTIDWRKLFILINVRIINTRSIQLAVEKIMLSANIEGEDCEAYAADDRVIYESRSYTEEGEEILEGQKFDNLKPASDSLMMIQPKTTCEGWLQFFLTPLDVEKGDELPATLTLIDIKGEKHSIELRLKYKE